MRVASVIVVAIVIGVVAGWLSLPRPEPEASAGPSGVAAAPANNTIPPAIGLTGDLRDSFIRGSMRLCVAAGLNGWSSSMIYNYCQCSAERFADTLSSADAMTILKTHRLSAAASATLDAIKGTCAQTVLH